ncbi:MAG: nucleoside deaminase [Tepidisphaeraceae bacterium]
MSISAYCGAMDPFLQAAIDEAKLGYSRGHGMPIGSVLVRDGKIIGRGHNKRLLDQPMTHAEIDCLNNAGQQKTYADCVLYSTLQPCYLCSGAVVQFGIPTVIVGEDRTFPGGEHKTCGLSGDFLRKHGVSVTVIQDPTCIAMMTEFIQKHPELWFPDIGQQPPK